MGSSSSSLGSSSRRKPSGFGVNRPKFKISSLFCGASAPQLEDRAYNSPSSSGENVVTRSDYSSTSTGESRSIFDSASSTNVEAGTSSGSSSCMIEDSTIEQNLRRLETPTCRLTDKASPREEGEVSGNSSTVLAAVGAHGILKEGGSLISNSHHSGDVTSEDGNPSMDVSPVGNNEDIDIDSRHMNSGSLSDFSGSVASLELNQADNFLDARSSSPGFLLSESEQVLRNGDMLHVNVVSISSNILSSSNAEIGYREARRNSRRLFWDALSRRSLRRHTDSPAIVFATGHADDLGSHDRWLLDLTGDLHYDGVGHDSDYLIGSHRRNERRWLLRSEISERVLSGLRDGDQETSICPSGLHPDGACSCEPFFMDEEFITLARISRILMLAEALFEVLDEMHRQPFSLSLSLPAPESVVDSFPLKYHKRLEQSESGDGQQCYICLAEYEDGEKLRVLPCHHEFHIFCIDKWLKEINRVCPVCRGNVCEASGEGSTATSEVLSL